MREQAKSHFLCKVLAVFLCLVSLSLVGAKSADAAGEIVFCKDVTPDCAPIEPAREFSTTKVSWVAKFSESCGAPQIMFSIYRKDANNTEEMLYRENVDVRPDWNVFVAKDLEFPGDGTYILAFNKLDGATLAEGTVTISAEVKPEEAAPLPETIEVEGSTIETLFNKFKTSAQPASN